MKLKNSIVKLLPGLYILRHPKGDLAPITIGRALGGPQSNGRVEVLCTSKTHGTVLRDGSDCIVMHVIGSPVELLVTAYLSHDTNEVPALKIDQIGLDPEHEQNEQTQPSEVLAIAKEPPAFEISATGISMIGHIERHGDVVVSQGQRLGEPAENRRLEGFQILWPDRAEGLDLAYSVTIEGRGATPMVTTGNFCGTRSEGRRITELTLAMVGPAAQKHLLKGVAYFSGGFQMPILSGVPASGPSGLEHLTAIEFIVESMHQSDAKTSPWTPSPRTKVFRAQNTKKK